MIQLTGLEILMKDQPLLKNINFQFEAGKLYRVTGPNGIGKTTFLESILGLYHECRGEINKTSSFRYSYLPQVSHQYPKIYLQLKDICSREFSFYKNNLFDKSWHTSSGGERKRSLIARSINTEFDCLILDEPFNHLDKSSIDQVCDEILRLSNLGKTIIFTGHEVEFAQAQNVELEKWKC